MKLLSIFIIWSLLVLNLYSQNNNNTIISQKDNLVINGSKIHAQYKKNYLYPLIGVLGINATMAGFNRYIANMDYAYINSCSIKKNFDVGFVWDDNNFPINQIGHPYQGGMYYAMAKYHGHDYLTSLAYSSFGSLQWEFFMETEYPAINDWITTSLSGPMLGEMLYHLGEKVLDDNSDGTERFFRELGAGLLSPMLGLNRLFTGESFASHSRRRTNTNTNIRSVIYAGGLVLKKGKHAKDTIPNISTGNIKLHLQYGNPYKVNKPFDFFLIDLGLNLSANRSGDLRAQGILWNTKLPWTKKGTLLNIYNNYDFIGSTIYKIGATSFGSGFTSFIPIKESGWNFIYNVQLNAIVMGGASTEYYFEDERDYNLGNGAGAKIIIGFIKEDFASINLKVDRYWIHTRSGMTGDEFIGLGTLKLDKQIWKRLGLSFTYNFYDRFGFYKKYNPDLENITVNAHEFKLYLTYKLS